MLWVKGKYTDQIACKSFSYAKDSSYFHPMHVSFQSKGRCNITPKKQQLYWRSHSKKGKWTSQYPAFSPLNWVIPLPANAVIVTNEHLHSFAVISLLSPWETDALIGRRSILKAINGMKMSLMCPMCYIFLFDNYTPCHVGVLHSPFAFFAWPCFLLSLSLSLWEPFLYKTIEDKAKECIASFLTPRLWWKTFLPIPLKGQFNIYGKHNCHLSYMSTKC